FAFARELEQRVEIVSHGADAVVMLERFLEPLALLHYLLALFRLIPEVGRADLLFDCVQLLFLLGSVKDTSARPEPVRGGVRIRVLILRLSSRYSNLIVANSPFSRH